MGKSGVLRLTLDRAPEHRGDGCLGFDTLHHDHAARRPPGDAAGGAGSSQGRRCECLAVVLACDVPADAAGERHGPHHQYHFQIETRRHRDQRDGRRTRRRHRHGVEFHLPRVPRSIECRIRHGARHVLPSHDHRLPDGAAAPVQSLDAESCISPIGRNRFLKGVARLAIFTSASQSVRRHHAAPRATRILSRVLIYSALLFWAFVCLFPIYWTVTTSFKSALDVTQGHLVPWLDFQPDWKGWRSLGLSPDTILQTSNPRDEFLSRFANSLMTSVGASVLALVLGSLAAYGLSRFRFRFGWMRNDDILFFFMSQL